MPDFWQHGPITTLQALAAEDPRLRDAEITACARRRPVALVLPCLYSELLGPALPRILEELSGVGYLHRVVVTLGVAGPEEFRAAREFFGRLPHPVRIVWNDGPRIRALKERIRATGLPLGEPGKGLAAWMAYGYLLADPDVAVIALHDTDIVTYERGLLDRLVRPLVRDDLGYGFAKGYYARVTDRLHGRATRLFVGPFLAALGRLVGPHPLLGYLGAFRYPLAGEFAMTEHMARVARVPADWGLEVGTLVEAYRICGPREVCQVDLAVEYEHKHQETGSGGDRPSGLVRMAREIAGTVLRALAEEGVALPEAALGSLPLAYLGEAREAVRRYGHLAAVNGLACDLHGESALAETFALALEAAVGSFLDRPSGVPPIPSWERVAAALPGIHDELVDAVEADHRG